MVNIINANCIDGLKELSDNSVDSVVTDPPYGLSFMGKAWDYDVPQAEIWQECLRVLKPGGYLLSFFGTRTYHRGVVQIEDAGFEIRDQIGWAYGSGFPKSHNIEKAINKLDGVEFKTKPASGVGFMNSDKEDGYNITVNQLEQVGESSKRAKQWHGWGTALKPAWEPICVARKPFKGTVADNVLKHGTGAINIDRCRVETEAGGRPLLEVHPMREGVNYSGNSLAGRVDGTLASSKAIGKTNLGRWPANLIHDGSEEVVGLFPNTVASNASARGLQHSGRHGGLADIGGNIKEGTNTVRGHNDNGGSAARFFYCAKASKKDREEGCEVLPEKQYSHDGREKPIDNAYQRNSNSNSNHHPTVKPTDLMRYLVRLITPPGGVVLDPFMGSGSTGKAAVLEGFGFIGMEREAEYCQIAEKRIAAADPGRQLLEGLI